jgi:hypothetical protein
VDKCKPLARGRTAPRGTVGAAPVGGRHHGRAVQVDPIKPKFKAPRMKLLKLQYDGPLSNSALKFNLRHYAMGFTRVLMPRAGAGPTLGQRQGVQVVLCNTLAEALTESLGVQPTRSGGDGGGGEGRGRGLHASTSQLNLSRV